MAWTSPPTFTNSVLTAAQMNIISGDLNETAAGRATQGGSIFVGTGANGLAERIPTIVYEFANESSTTTTYANLLTVGPNVTVTTGTKAIVATSSIMYNNTAGQYICASTAIYTPPATLTQAPDDNWAVLFKEGSGGAATTGAATRMMMFTGLTAQSNLFQMKYRVSGGTGTWDDRSLLVIPL